MSVDTAAIFIYFNSEMSFSIPSVLCCNVPLVFCSSLLSQPRSSIPARSFHMLLLQSTCIQVNFCPLLNSGSFFISLEFVLLFGFWQIQGQLCLALHLCMPSGGGIFDNHGCKEPLGVYGSQLLLEFQQHSEDWNTGYSWCNNHYHVKL